MGGWVGRTLGVFVLFCLLLCSFFSSSSSSSFSSSSSCLMRHLYPIHTIHFFCFFFFSLSLSHPPTHLPLL